MSDRAGVPTREALARLEAWPRQLLAMLPTQLVAADQLTRSLGASAPRIFMKIDADTGLGLGGNKVRKLEFELAPERIAGVTHVITTGGPQSNHCRVTAAASAHLGRKCVLVINGTVEGKPRGNALLQRLFGADIRTVAGRAGRAPAMEAAALEIAAAGGKTLVIPLGASTPLGSLGYARAAVELEAQLAQLPPVADTWIFLSSSSCGTLAGLLLGFSLLERDDVRLVGVSADTPEAEMRRDAVRLATEGGALLGWTGRLLSDHLFCDDTQVGDGYGIPTPASDEATRLLGATQGVVLDPYYTAKAMAGMLAWIRSGRVAAGDRVVFVHTGGHPALLA
jgi:1-aminocyclopropane-1-carboxylate deaminase/D-cysteine desulfhydrase-like pyridoxal-dependent ACC family enzyme